MANSKITDLPEAPSAATDDVLVIVDVSSDETKKIKTETLKTSLAITKSDVGLSNVDNTSDINKPISTATQTALNLKTNESSFQSHISDLSNPHSVTKSQVGLSNADNTADVDKPISSATQTALDLKYDASNPSGFITLAEVPANAVSSVNTKVGAVVLDKSDIGLSNIDNTSDADKPISTATQTALNLKANSSDIYTKIESDDNFEPKNSNIQAHISNTSNPHNVTKSQVGLSNVDNTSDLDKPTSTATQTALNLKEDSSNKGALNGYAPLVDGLIPAIYLPSYVDQVVEVANYASLPNPGEVSVIYITLDDHKTYRWSGSTYIEVSPSDVNSVNGHTGIVVLTKSDIGLSDVDNTSDINKPISTATQTALDGKINKAGDSVDGQLEWQFSMTNGINTQTFKNEIKGDEVKVQSYWNNANPTKVVTLRATGITVTTNGLPTLPFSDDELVVKKYVDDGLSAKYDASNPNGFITLAEVPAAPVTSVNSQTGDVVLDKSSIGLSDVDNTSDAAKPISTATQGALDAKANSNFDNLEESGIGAYTLPDNIILNPSSSQATIQTAVSKNLNIQSAENLSTTSDSGAIVISSGYSNRKSGNVTVTSGETDLNDSGALLLKTGNAVTIGNSGQVILASGSCATGTGSSGDVNINSGESSGISGQVNISSGQGISLGNSGNVEIKSGNTENSDSGDVSINTGDIQTTSTSSGNITLKTGNNASGTGNIFLHTGSPSVGGSQGTIQVNTILNMGANRIASVSNPTDAQDAVTLSFMQTALSGKSNTDHTHSDATTSVAGFMSTADKSKLDKLTGKIIGPAQLLSFSNTLFENSGYVPGISTNSTPSAFGFYSVQNLNFIFNPFLMFGPNKNYRIRAIRRQTGAFNDGTHCMIRQVIQGSGEVGVIGLTDFGSGNNEYAEAISNIYTSQSSSTNIWYRVYFAAYNGGNGATVQDVTLYFEEVI